MFRLMGPAQFLATIAIAAIAAIMWVFLHDDGSKVSREDFGEAWPFYVDEGRLDCRNGNALTFSAHGTTYGLNGFGMLLKGTSDLEKVWRRNPDNLSLRVDIAPIMAAAERLC